MSTTELVRVRSNSELVTSRARARPHYSPRRPSEFSGPKLEIQIEIQIEIH